MHLSSHVQPMSQFEHISVRPLSGALGAEVSRVDLSEPIPDKVFAEILSAFHTHLVLFFRAQTLTRDHLKGFSRRFGPLFRQPNVEALAGDPDVVAVLQEANETGISTFGGTWHSDLSYLEAPPMGSVLYAVEVPPHGGDTIWANQYLAYEALSDGFKKMLDGLACVQVGAPHGVAHAPPADLAVSRSIRLVRGDPEADRERLHPTVRTHPETGRKALFVNSVYSLRFEDMSAEESAPLLRYRFDHATRPEFCFRFSWGRGDLAVWDNRCTQHLAVNDYDGFRRLMYRTAVAGDRPR